MLNSYPLPLSPCRKPPLTCWTCVQNRPKRPLRPATGALDDWNGCGTYGLKTGGSPTHILCRHRPFSGTHWYRVRIRLALEASNGRQDVVEVNGLIRHLRLQVGPGRINGRWIALELRDDGQDIQECRLTITERSCHISALSGGYRERIGAGGTKLVARSYFVQRVWND